ncbi:MAG TPA: glycosyltransferase family 4 protein [Candidatus Paceibacterota bacterium]|nr:glycosyltransferase family 4 protein [Candidatus Paceibacterota bacterium]
MKLLICTQALDQNDSNLGFFHQWVAEFAKHCEKVIVICLREGAHDLPRNVEIVSLGKERGTGRLARIILFLRCAVSRRNDYDAVFVHMNPEYIVLVGPLWRLWGKRVSLWYAHKSVTFWLRVAVGFANAIFTVAPGSFRIRTSKLRAVGHGIDTGIFRPGAHEPGDRLRVATMGRVAASKHLLEMLSALDVLHARGIQFTLSIAGSPVSEAEKAYAKELEREISSRPYAAQVRMLGPVPHAALPEFLRRQDVFLNFATTGNMDKAGLEALASGVPVVASNESFKALLEPHGLFAPLKDAERLADAILRAPQLDMRKLEEEVERDHSLVRLIPRILALLS